MCDLHCFNHSSAVTLLFNKRHLYATRNVNSARPCRWFSFSLGVVSEKFGMIIIKNIEYSEVQINHHSSILTFKLRLHYPTNC